MWQVILRHQGLCPPDENKYFKYEQDAREHFNNLLYSCFNETGSDINIIPNKTIYYIGKYVVIMTYNPDESAVLC